MLLDSETKHSEQTFSDISENDGVDYLDTVVSVDKTQDVQKLSLVLVDALDLYIEERLRRHLKQ